MSSIGSAASDTIAAIATPAGRGGLGVVRLSGAEALPIAQRILSTPPLMPSRVRLARFLDDAGALLDEVLVTWFRAPHSYTAEDVVEIAAHGSPVLLRALLDAALRQGARLADPGEFTRRAFLNGRIDLTQAEAVRDLIEAQTLFQVRTAAQQLGGSIARQLRPAKDHLLELIALLEAGIDFADNDVSFLGYPAILERIAGVEAALEPLRASLASGRLIREGLVLAIVGRPNVGKSSLFNRLVEADRAIVTAQAGTTRDLIAEQFSLDGIPVRLLDTAGIRETSEEIERLGIEKSWQAIADADLVLAVLDLSRPPEPELQVLLARLYQLPTVHWVLNKSDLAGDGESAWRAALGVDLAPVSTVSALSGAGMAELRAALRRQLLPDLAQGGAPMTNLRQAEHIRHTLNALQEAREAALVPMPHEVVMVGLYAALGELDAITGQTTVEDILGLIFSKFCVGK